MPARSLPRWVLVAALFSGTPFVGCDGDGTPDVPRATGGSGGLGGSGGGSGAPDSGAGDGNVNDAGEASIADAPLAPVELGIIPVAKPGDGGSSPADQTAALLEVVSVGSRGVSFVRRWDALFSSPTAPVAEQWSSLQSAGSLLRDGGRGLLFSVAITDRTLDARPSGLTGSFQDPATLAAVDTLIDRVFATFGSELVALSFGNEVDRWLGQASAGERADMLALLNHAVSYARTNPARPSATVVGVTLTSDAIVGGKPAEVSNLIALGDVVVATYYPLDAKFHARPAAGAAADLDALVGALTPDAGDAAPAPRVFLQEIGYPSATESQSSPAQQSAFYDAVFQALLARRDRFPFLSVNGLYDWDPATCANEAVALGVPGNAAAATARCSLGLRDATGNQKPAYASVLDALATFAAP